MNPASRVRMIEAGGQIFFCPGCEDLHAVNTNPTGPRWSYNGDPVSPTFSPSIHVSSSWKGRPTICHSFVRQGNIQFLQDCTHKMAGQTVAIPIWPYAPGDFGGLVSEP